MAVHLDAAVHRAIKVYAAQHDLSFAQVIERAWAAFEKSTESAKQTQGT